MTPLRWLVFAGLLAVLGLAGFGLWSTHQARQQLQADLAAARAALREGEHARAAQLARTVLAREPATGRAFGVLARALADEDSAATRQRYDVAARRAPRDPAVRAWLVARTLEAGDYPAAIDHLDVLLTVVPSQRPAVLQLVAQLSQDASFAEALATHLLQHPRWRRSILSAAGAPGLGAAADNLHGALRARGGLDPAETARWLDGMLRDGRWGDAYARWVSGLDALPSRLPVPWNGDFAAAPTSSGFDWRVRRTPGVLFDRVALPEGGHAARLRFLGRAVARTGLEVPLLLGAGDHVLRLRARTSGFRSDQGLEWTLACGDGRGLLASGARLREARDWSGLELAFTVPARAGCEGQWLRLVNPAPRGVAQTLRGEVQLAQVRIDPVPVAAPDAIANAPGTPVIRE